MQYLTDPAYFIYPGSTVKHLIDPFDRGNTVCGLWEYNMMENVGKMAIHATENQIPDLCGNCHRIVKSRNRKSALVTMFSRL